MSDYPVPAAGARREIIVKRSRFIASLAHAADRRQAEQFIEERKREFADATHNAHAFIAGQGGDAMACSDDGEVSGTAGRPMLSLLQHEGLGDVVVVVTRYYGGTLLGTGGLQRAYTQALKEALLATPRRAGGPRGHYRLRCRFADEPSVRQCLLHSGAELLGQRHVELAVLDIALPQTRWPTLHQQLWNRTRGQLQAEPL